MKIRKQFVTSLAICSLLLSYSSPVLAQVETTPSSTSQEPTTETDITTAVTTINSLSESTESSVTTTEPRVETTVPSSEETTTSGTTVDIPTTTEPETETSEAVGENEAGVKINPIHLSVEKGPWWDTRITVRAKLDWTPQKYQGEYEVVDSLGRQMHHSYLNIYNLSGSEYFDVEDYPNGVYTIIVRGETDYRDQNQKFRGKISFEVKNGQLFQVVPIPNALKNIDTAIDYVNVGINPMRLSIEKGPWRNTRITVRANLDWNPYTFTGNYKVYDVQRRFIHSSTLYISHLSGSDYFDVSDFPNGVFVIVAEGITGPGNKNQKFRGVIAFEVKNGELLQQVSVPPGFDTGTRSVESITRSIKSGQTPSLPKTVKVTWLDGTVTNEAVTWSKGDFTNKSNKAKTVKLTGTVANTTAKTTATITVHGISSISSTKLTTKSGQVPGLPKTVQVTWTDGSKSNEAVNWGNLKAASFISSKQKDVKLTGALTKTTLKANATVTILAVTKITSPTILTTANQAPTMPATVQVRWSNNTVTNEKVQWDKIPASSYTTTKDKSFTVKGKLVGISTALTASAKVNVTTKLNTMYRLYNPNNYEHFYTASLNERDTLVRIGWGHYEGIAWHAPLSGTPVYRLYHKDFRDHHYTLDKNERDTLVAKHGWINEGIAWYSGGTKPLYRLYNPRLTSGSHHYTTDANERDVLVAQHGWIYEGIAWYGVK